MHVVSVFAVEILIADKSFAAAIVFVLRSVAPVAFAAVLENLFPVAKSPHAPAAE
jgi:hypothetical protein